MNGGTGQNIYLTNNSFFRNESNLSEGTDIFTQGFNLIIKNAIHWSDQDDVHIFSYSDVTVDYSIIKDGVSSIIVGGSSNYGDGIIQNNPLFVDENSDNYRLLSSSPAIDAGDPNSEYDPDTTVADLGSFYFDQRDLENPNVDIESIPNSVGTNDSLLLSWVATDNIGLEQAFIYFNVDLSPSSSLIDSISANEGQYVFDVPDSALFEDARLIVQVFDMAGNYSNDTTNFFSIVDNTSPSVQILHPLVDFSIPENELFNVVWSSSDNIELSHHIFEFSSDGIDFDTLLSFPFSAHLDSIQFELDGVTESAQVRVTAIDVAGNNSSDISEQFLITDNTPPIVNLIQPLNGIVTGIGDQLQITWNDTDNVKVQSFSLSYNTGEDWISIDQNIQNVNSYNWIVPNQPTDDLQIRLIGQDEAGLSDTSKVGGITIQISYPMVESTFPMEEIIDFNTSEFYFFISQPLDESTVTNENIYFESSYATSLVPTFTYIDSINSVKVSFDNIVSMDSITFTLTENLTNIYGYSLDGNGDGIGGDNYIINFKTSMLADYNNDMAITIEDLSQFILNWENESYDYELGPFIGDIPHVYLNPDNIYNYQDMHAFAQMWRWYYSTNTMSFVNYENDGLPIIIEAEHDSIYLDIPSDLSAYQVQIQYTPGSFFIGNSDDKEGMFLTHQDQELGVYTIMAQPGQDQLAIPIEIRGRDANISISYKGISGQGELAGQMTKSITIENVPDEFVLYDNYPNPFNPTTKINYGLPNEANVLLVIYDILGREVIKLANDLQEPGYKSITWNGTDALGRNVSAGMYFYLLQTGEFRQTRKMILLK